MSKVDESIEELLNPQEENELKEKKKAKISLKPGVSVDSDISLLNE